MSNEAPPGSPGPAPRSRAPHYIGLVAVVVILAVIFLAVR